MLITEFLASQPLAFAVLALIIGLLVGSFLNVLIYRLPIMMQREWQAEAKEILAISHEPNKEPFNLFLPNSCCPNCQHEIRLWENIPLLSWLFLRGRCSNCRQPISTRYPIIELSSGLIAGFIAWHFGFGWPAAAMIVLSWGLLAMSMIDADHQLLPDSLVLPLLWLGLICNAFNLFTDLETALWGAIWGYLSLWIVFWGFKLLTGKEGMGHGDFKLLALIGAWGGWQVLPLTILLSSVVGAILGIIILRMRKAESSTPLPFGPYLALAGWIALIWGEQITETYLQFARF